MDPELKDRINEAATVADDFIKRYYDDIDKGKSVQVQKLYMDTAILVYNGNGIAGVEHITKFIQDMPASEHSITTVDAQPILDISAGRSLLIQISGTVKYENQKQSQAFQQSFLITAQDSKWKIVSDTFRLQNGIYG